MIMQLIMILSCVLQDWSYFYASSVLLAVILNTVIVLIYAVEYIYFPSAVHFVTLIFPVPVQSKCLV